VTLAWSVAVTVRLTEPVAVGVPLTVSVLPLTAALRPAGSGAEVVNERVTAPLPPLTVMAWL
jgi:hypothetical protein